MTSRTTRTSYETPLSNQTPPTRTTRTSEEVLTRKAVGADTARTTRISLEVLTARGATLDVARTSRVSIELLGMSESEAGNKNFWGLDAGGLQPQ